MKSSATKYVKAFAIIAVGLIICIGLIWLGDYDDAPGASFLGILLLIGSIILSVRILMRKAAS